MVVAAQPVPWVRPAGSGWAACDAWNRLVKVRIDDAEVQAIRRHGRTGRPLGERAFVRRLERRHGRRLLPGQPRRPRKRTE